GLRRFVGALDLVGALLRERDLLVRRFEQPRCVHVRPQDDAGAGGAEDEREQPDLSAREEQRHRRDHDPDLGAELRSRRADHRGAKREHDTERALPLAGVHFNQRWSSASKPPMSTWRAPSSTRPARVAAARDRCGHGASQTRRPPGASAAAACPTKRSSSASSPGLRAARRPIGGLVMTRVTPSGAAASTSRSSRRAVRPAAARVSRATSRAWGSMSPPTRARYGPSGARSTSSAPEPANGSQTTSSSRTPATRASAAARGGGAAAGPSPRRQVKRGSTIPRG